MAYDPRRAGLLRERVLLQQRAADANGDPTGAWITQFVCSARIQYLRGGERVQEGRLQGEQPTVISVRSCAATRAVTDGWRVVDRIDASRVWDIKAVEPDERRAWVDLICTRYVGQPREA